MKILRVRRGYTTNSSSYTEWLPPEQGSASGQAGTPSSGGANAGQAQPAAQAPAVAAGAAQTVAVAGNAPASQQPASHAAGNGLVLGGLIAGVLALFLGERLIRRLRRKSSEPSDGDES